MLDNVDSEDKRSLLQEYLPVANRGSILITSRDSSLLGQFDGCELSALDETPAVDLLVKLSHFNLDQMHDNARAEQMDAAQKIVHQVGYLPIGIRQAANLMNNERCPMDEYLKIYDNEDLIEETESLQLIRRRPDDYPHSLSTVWNMNLKRLTRDQQSLLNIMAFCDPDRFQLRILNQAAAKTADPSLHFINNPKKIHKCKLALVRSSLVNGNEDLSPDPSSPTSPDDTTGFEASRDVSLHRLVQATCHLRMESEERTRHFRWAVALLKASWPVAQRSANYDPLLW